MLAWMVFVTVFVVPAALLCGRFTAKNAPARGRSKRIWFFWGALLFPLPWVVLELLPSRNRQVAANQG